MKPKTPIPIVKVDYTKKAWEQTTTALHNRWHPDLPVVRTLILWDVSIACELLLSAKYTLPIPFAPYCSRLTLPLCQLSLMNGMPLARWVR